MPNETLYLMHYTVFMKFCKILFVLNKSQDGRKTIIFQEVFDVAKDDSREGDNMREKTPPIRSSLKPVNALFA